jgi:hypothetical protein
MTKCPLCNSELAINDRYGSFYCLTKVGQYNHFYCNNYGENPFGRHAEYTIYTQGFLLCWTDGNDHDLRIYSLTTNFSSGTCWKYVMSVSFQEFINWAKRLQDLRAFL